MPIRWWVDYDKTKINFDMKDSLECWTKEVGTIPANSMQCTFALYNAGAFSVNNYTPIWKGTIPCFTKWWYDPTQKKDIGSVKLFDSVLPKDDTNAVGKAFIKLDIPSLKTLGEYQIQLQDITYEQCNGKASEQLSQTRVCAMNIAVTDHYMIEKGTTLTSVTSNILGRFKELNGAVVIKQPLPVKWIEKKDVNYFTNEFVAKRQSKATKSVTSIDGTSLRVSAWLKQVPGSQMYFYDGWDLTIDDILPNVNKPFTLVVTNGNVRVVGSFDSSSMIIANNGRIEFVNKDCQTALVAKDQGYKDTVAGIFIAKNWFDAPVIANTNMNTSWCYEWGLIIKGILMTQADGWIENLVQAKRSSLNSWFDIGVSSKETKLLNGASVRVEANTKLRSNLPPEADAMMKWLQVSK
jgi:hypothetical protein